MQVKESPIIGLTFEKNHETGISEYSEEYFDTCEEVHHCSDGKVHQVISLEILDEGQAIKNHDGSEVIFPSVSLNEGGAKALIQRLQKFVNKDSFKFTAQGINIQIPASEASNILIRSSDPGASFATITIHNRFKIDVPMDIAKLVGQWMEDLNVVDPARSGVYVHPFRS